MMKVLLTGSSGMVGRNILDHRLSCNYNFLTPSSRELDLRNFDSVKEYIAINRPDFVIHAAGKVGGIQANIKEPVNFLVENLDMGRNLIMASKINNVKNLLNLASSCMYPRNASNPLSENLILTGELEPTNEGYAIAKIMTTRLCEFINKEDDTMSYKTVIPCNLYGKYDKFNPYNSHLIPAVITKLHEAMLSERNEVAIWGDGSARREFMYAGDFADFIMYAIENFNKMPQNLNVGMGRDFSIDEYYSIIGNILGYDGKFIHDCTKPAGMRQKLIDIVKLNDFGWKSETTLKDGLIKTINYFKLEVGHETL